MVGTGGFSWRTRCLAVPEAENRTRVPTFIPIYRMSTIKKSNLYTSTGDNGTTSLVGGRRISKSDTRIEAYGAVDELNSHLGLLASLAGSDDEVLRTRLSSIQHRLFDIGAALATYTESDEEVPKGVSDEVVAILESWIDQTDAGLPPLRNFILPGGSVASSQAQVARTVCRRAERRIVSLAAEAGVSPTIIRYMNRLSDYLFALARHLNVSSGTEETVWRKEG